jgi:hypothetical protein
MAVKELSIIARKLSEVNWLERDVLPEFDHNTPLVLRIFGGNITP